MTYPAWLSPKPTNTHPKAIARLGGIKRFALMSLRERFLHQQKAGRAAAKKRSREQHVKGGKAAAALLTPEQHKERMALVRKARESK